MITPEEIGRKVEEEKEKEQKIPQLPIKHKLQKLERMMPLVGLCRDFFKGVGELHMPNKITEYFPKYPNETNLLYQRRIDGTCFVNYYAPVIMTLYSLATSQPPIIEGVDEVFKKNVDNTGTDFVEFMRKVVTSTLVSGLEFVGVEKDYEGNTYFKRYLYEQLISYSMSNGKITGLLFRDDLEQTTLCERDRVERIIWFEIGGGYTYIKGPDGEYKGQRWNNDLDFIPIVPFIFGKESSPFEVFPLFLDLAKANKALLKAETEKSSLRIQTANPLIVGYGIEGKPDGEDFLSDEDMEKLNDDEKQAVLDAQKGSASVMQTLGRDMILLPNKITADIQYKTVPGDILASIDASINNDRLGLEKMAYEIISREKNKTVLDSEENQSKTRTIMANVSTSAEIGFMKLFEYKDKLERKEEPTEVKIKFRGNFNNTGIDQGKWALILDLAGKGILTKKNIITLIKEEGAFANKDLIDNLKTEGEIEVGLKKNT